MANYVVPEAYIEHLKIVSILNEECYICYEDNINLMETLIKQYLVHTK